MGIVEVFLIGVGLSMDAFAVSVCKGLGMKRIDYKAAAIIALFFGVFQAAMPLIGWALGSQLQWLIEPVDHWVAFGLLVLIGGKMIWDAVNDEDNETQEFKLDYKELVLLAIATSIDALATGIAFSCTQVSIVPAVVLVGCTTFVISIIGVCIGNRFGSRYEKPSAIVGGIVLIIIGVKVLLEHLGILPF